MTKAPKTLTVIEQHELLEALTPNNCSAIKFAKGIRNYTLAVIMLEAGLRVGEVVRLAVSDLQMNCEPNRSIIIGREIAEKGCERQIPVSGRLCKAIKSLNEYYWSRYQISASDIAFGNGRANRPLTIRQVQRIIRDAAIKSIGRPIHPHILRHTFASKLMRVTDMRTVQTLLGHKNLSSTQVYTHPDNDDLTLAIDNMDNGRKQG